MDFPNLRENTEAKSSRIYQGLDLGTIIITEVELTGQGVEVLLETSISKASRNRYTYSILSKTSVLEPIRKYCVGLLN